MATYRIWGKYENQPIEKIDEFGSQGEAARMLYEYRMSFGALPGQHAHAKWKLWVGKKTECPQ